MRIKDKGAQLYVITIFVFGLSLLPMIILSINSYTDPFLHYDIAFITKYQSAGFIPVFSHETYVIPAMVMEVSILSKITGMPATEIQYLPLLGFPIIGTLYVLLKRLFYETLLASLITLLISYGFISSYYNVWRHSFGTLLFLTIVVTLLLKHRKLHLDTRVILLLILFSLAIHFYDYTAELWNTLFLVCLTVITLRKRHYFNATSIAVFILVIFLGYNNVIYGALNEGIVLFGVGLHTSKYFRSLLTREKIKYLYYAERPFLLSFLNGLYLVALLQPIAIYTLLSFKRIISGSGQNKCKIEFKSLDLERIIYWSLLMVIIGDVIVYLLRGVIFFRMLLFLGPILATLCFNFFNSLRKYRILYLLILASILLSSWSWYYSLGDFISSKSRYVEFTPGAVWLLTHVPQNYWQTVNSYPRYAMGPITDHFTGGLYSIVAAELQVPYNSKVFDPNIYSHLVEQVESRNPFFEGEIIIVNKKFNNKITYGLHWKHLEPLSSYLKQICRNINIDKVYDSNLVWTFIGIPTF